MVPAPVPRASENTTLTLVELAEPDAETRVGAVVSVDVCPGGTPVVFVEKVEARFSLVSLRPPTPLPPVSV